MIGLKLKEKVCVTIQRFVKNVQIEASLSGSAVKRQQPTRSSKLARVYRRRNIVRRTWGGILAAGVVGLLVAVILIEHVRVRIQAERSDRQAADGQILLQSDDLAGAEALYRQVVLDNPQVVGHHRDLAETLLKRGKTAEATAEYAAVADIDQRDVASRGELAWLAALRFDWEEVERRGDEVLRLDPSGQQAKSILLALRLRGALDSGDLGRLDAVRREARRLISENPNNMLARLALIEVLRVGADPYMSVPELDAAIALAPRLTELRDRKLSIYSRARDRVRGGALLKELHATFPDNPDYATWLEEWFVDGSNAAGALDMLRAIDARSGGNLNASQKRVDFAMKQIGPEAASVELARLLAAAPDGPEADNYRAQMAQISFDAGHQTEAVGKLEDILATVRPSDESRRIKLQLVGYLIQLGRIADARSRVREILAEESGNVEALKREAEWLIADGDPRQARAMLTIAANEAANDPKVASLLADTFRAEGAVASEGEKRRLAVSLSNFGHEESVALYRYLMRIGRSEIATQVLTRAYVKHPEDRSLLSVLAEDAIFRFHWIEADDFIATINALNQTENHAVASALIRMRNAAQLRAESISAIMERLALNAGADRSSSLDLLRSQIEQSRLGDAVRTVNQMIRAEQTEQLLPYLLFWLQASLGLVPDAIATLGALPENTSFTTVASIQIYELLVEQGRPQEASDFLARSLAKRPRSADFGRLSAEELACAGENRRVLAISRSILSAHPEDKNAMAAFALLPSEQAPVVASLNCPSAFP